MNHASDASAFASLLLKPVTHDTEAATFNAVSDQLSGVPSSIRCNSSASTRLIILRGNSGSGKTSVARAVRDAYRRRGMALISQDVVRRDILRERDTADAVNIGLIDLMCRHALDAGYHVLLEGILARSRYGRMLQSLCDDHRGTTTVFYMDISLEETLRRHASRPLSAQFGGEVMREWYCERDLLACGGEIVIGEGSSLEETVRRIVSEADLNATHSHHCDPWP